MTKKRRNWPTAVTIRRMLLDPEIIGAPGIVKRLGGRFSPSGLLLHMRRLGIPGRPVARMEQMTEDELSALLSDCGGSHDRLCTRLHVDHPAYRRVMREKGLWVPEGARPRRLERMGDDDLLAVMDTSEDAPQAARRLRVNERTLWAEMGRRWLAERRPEKRVAAHENLG